MVVVGGSVVVVLVDVLVDVVDVDVEVEVDDAAGSASPMSLLQAATVPTRNATATRRRANEAGRAGGVRVTPTSLTDRAAQLKSWCEAVTMLGPIRHARRTDVTAMIAIAEDGDAPGVDEGYLDFVAAQGRLMVGCEGLDGPVLGFAGSIPVGGAAMVTDLFVSTLHRGAGLGGALLSAVTDGFERRMTCSSAHPAARAAYARAGLEPRWPVLVLQGDAHGGGGGLAEGPWCHDRHELIDYYRSTGAHIGPGHVVHRAVTGGAVHRVLRMVSARPTLDAARRLAALPAGEPVEWCVPARSPFAERLVAHGFEVVDEDLFCATPGLDLEPELVALHRGLL